MIVIPPCFTSKATRLLALRLQHESRGRSPSEAAGRGRDARASAQSPGSLEHPAARRSGWARHRAAPATHRKSKPVDDSIDILERGFFDPRRGTSTPRTPEEAVGCSGFVAIALACTPRYARKDSSPTVHPLGQGRRSSRQASSRGASPAHASAWSLIGFEAIVLPRGASQREPGPCGGGDRPARQPPSEEVAE
jgi:hypothetical protein